MGISRYPSHSEKTASSTGGVHILLSVQADGGHDVMNYRFLVSCEKARNPVNNAAGREFASEKGAPKAGFTALASDNKMLLALVLPIIAQTPQDLAEMCASITGSDGGGVMVGSKCIVSYLDDPQLWPDVRGCPGREPNPPPASRL